MKKEKKRGISKYSLYLLITNDFKITVTATKENTHSHHIQNNLKTNINILIGDMDVNSEAKEQDTLYKNDIVMIDKEIDPEMTSSGTS